MGLVSRQMQFKKLQETTNTLAEEFVEIGATGESPRHCHA